MKPEISLRSYQNSAVGAAVDVVNACIVAPTGAGKTRIGLGLVARLGLPTTWIVHRNSLERQTKNVLRQFGVSAQVDTIQGLLRKPSGQTGGVVILDEAHHYVAREWLSAWSAIQPERVYGLTATPERADGTPLCDIFDNLITTVGYSRLISEGILTDCRVFAPDSLDRKSLAEDPVDAYLKHGEGRHGFMFCTSIDQCRKYAMKFQSSGVRAEVYCQDTPKRDRVRLLGKLGSGELDLLVSVYALTEGVDVPSASIAILARPSSHVSPYLQMAGRILRAAEGKSNGLLIDLCGSYHLHGSPVEDREYSIDGGIRKIAQTHPQPPGRINPFSELAAFVREDMPVIMRRLREWFSARLARRMA